ncbi:histidine phosphatase family protein [Lysinimonas soli]|uniref:Histidine phosphatase family protein n=1 Tax=Lysinimonas soli TaxID=1074233 RepID=A0ABW0NSM9_9MICO
MPADLIHLVRHGEVFNPDGVLYGRLPEFHLSERGRRMAQLAASSLAGRPIVAVTASPLTRTRESAEPWIDRFRDGLGGEGLRIDERLIEPANRFEGLNIRAALKRDPFLARHLLNPWRPSWGEPFASIAARMMAAVADAHAGVEGGEVVLVSHQLPIWMVARTAQGKPLATDPRRRRCSLSSITTLAHDPAVAVPGAAGFVEVDYQEPAAELLAEAIDLGAV